MSWNNVSSELYRLDSNNLRDNAGLHTRLSATHLLSPDGSRNLLANSTDNGFNNEGISLFNRLPRPRSSMFDCFFSCHRSVKEYLARKKIERGLRLYEKVKRRVWPDIIFALADILEIQLSLFHLQHHPNAAVKTWQSALESCSRREDRFVLLSYLYQAHMDWGKFRDALDYGHHQLGISEELDNPQMRSEAYLNLARAHERLGCLERSLMYARHSLYNECEAQSRNGGLVHLTVASVYLELGGFRRCLEGLQGAHKIAMNIGDPALELQVYVLLSELFHRLCDFEKSARYASKAYDLSRSLQLGDLNSRHHRAALLRMASALNKQGELGDARDYVEEATRLALISGDQATYTRSIRIMGDIYRKKLDIDRAFRQYEQAMGAAANMADRMSQMEAMDGAARCLESLRLQNKICSCRPLEFNTRLLEVCNSIGSKMLVRKVRLRLAQIYRSLGDEENYQNHIKLATQTEHSLGLNCCLCGETYGLQNDSLEALPCAHILHHRCAQEILRNRDKNNPRQCPACNHLFNSNLHLCAKLPTDGDGDEILNEILLSHANSIRPAGRKSNLSLASLNLRASSLTINSDCNNITSSV